MSRGVSPGRNIIYIEPWKSALKKAVADRGRRTELAEWLKSKFGSTVETWKVKISRILNTNQIPDGEFVLAVNHWLRTRKSAKQKSRT